MAMQTIYIRKENEKFFEQLENKSKVINGILTELRHESEETKS